MPVNTEARYLDIGLRRRPRPNEGNAELNARVLAQLVQLPGFWRPDGDTRRIRFEDYEGGLWVDLRRALSWGSEGRIVYRPRFPSIIENDVAVNDDRMEFILDTERLDVMMVVTDEDLRAADWEIICARSRETNQHSDAKEGRHAVYRIWPVCYFDDLLRRRAFGLPAAQVVARAAPECGRAELINDDAFLLVTTARPTGSAELDALDARLRARLAS